jgi:hexosaminidase
LPSCLLIIFIIQVPFKAVLTPENKPFIMKKLCWFFLLLPILTHAQEISIIPQPASLKVGKGNFIITKNTALVVQDQMDRAAVDFFNTYMAQFYGFQLPVQKQSAKNSIRLYTRKFIKAPDNDAYTFASSPNGVSIEGDTYAGTFYGVQTLIQLLPVQKSAALKIPVVSVQDEPRFAYRGLHLDVGRHFFPVDFIKKYIDYIALHKMNYFHWHPTEDQGWRIEIKKYPKLTEIASCRNGTIIGSLPGTGNDNTKYCGYYTQEQIKDIVKYAADRYITIIPEIELPGHSSAAIAAYPELSCFPNESTKHPKEYAWSGDTTGKQVQQAWGVYEDVFCAGKENTFQFLEDVMDEVLTLFPSKMIHVGGDECPKANWKRCPNCQKRMKENGLKDEHELQSYFTQRMEKYLNSKGRTLIGWDEILEGGLAPKAVVMSWRGEEGGIAAARQKHDVIMTPWRQVYLNLSQSQNEDSVTYEGFTTVEKIYSYEPIPEVLNEEQAKHVLGAQGSVWTEYMRNPRIVEYMIFPRLSALSEVLWSPKSTGSGGEKKNWEDFQQRLQMQFKRYDLWKAGYNKKGINKAE